MTSLQVASLRVLGTIAVFGILCGTFAYAQTETTLFTFPNGTTTTNPYTLISDGHGNFFGTAIGGNGSVFELSPATGGGWTVTTIYAFPGATGPYYPEALVMDTAGNLYGANNGGRLTNVYGEIYKLSPNGQGGWTYSTIYQFHGSDGRFPQGSLLFDSAGNLYGTTNQGGQCATDSMGCGLVYELSPQSDGKWKEHLLYHFGEFSGDGRYPLAGLVFDSKGNLYGTTAVDGAFGDGTVFKLTLTSDGQWRFRVLYNFRIEYAGSGSFSTGVVFDHAGNLYGTIWGPPSGNCNGGGCGLIYKLAPQPSGPWKYSVVHTFEGNDGGDPTSTLIIDKNGNLYGTTGIGGANGYGVVFELTP